MFVRRSLPFLIAIGLLLAVVLARGHHRGQELTFLAVGQGDCIVWRDDQVTVLIDVGPMTREGFDAGKRIVMPKLRKMGVMSVDFIVITHPDADHIGGLRSLMFKYPQARIIANEAFRKHPEMLSSLRDAGMPANDSRIMWVTGKNRVTLPNSQLNIAAPHLAEGANDNEGSLFVQIRSEKASAVLTGDASMSTESVMQGHLRWSGQVLKVGHHGSRTSTGEDFLRSVSPKWAVVSCGRENRFGHPHLSVTDLLKQKGVQTFRTDLSGDLSFGAGPQGFSPKD